MESEKGSQGINTVKAVLLSDNLDVLKLAVTDEMITLIKSDSYSTELIFDTLQTSKTSCRHALSITYTRLLYVNEGEYEGILFYGDESGYKSGPLKEFI